MEWKELRLVMGLEYCSSLFSYFGLCSFYFHGLSYLIRKQNIPKCELLSCHGQLLCFYQMCHPNVLPYAQVQPGYEAFSIGTAVSMLKDGRCIQEVSLTGDFMRG